MHGLPPVAAVDSPLRLFVPQQHRRQRPKKGTCVSRSSPTRLPILIELTMHSMAAVRVVWGKGLPAFTLDEPRRLFSFFLRLRPHLKHDVAVAQRDHAAYEELKLERSAVDLVP